MAAGVATAQVIENENILDNVQQMSDRFREKFTALQEELSIIKEIRICGMMVGLDLTVPSTPAVGKCMERGVLVNATHDTVLRLLPALNVNEEQVDEGYAVIADVLREMDQEV
jgi:acetylornithine/succinyldiaminopimelate/putrescine aminotransferase